MDNQQNNTEIIIKQDLDNVLSGIRLFHEDKGTNVNEITKNIIKYSPVSIILKIQALKELGKTAILLEIEKQLVNLSNKLIPNLTLQLKSHLSSNGNELSGDLPFFGEYTKYFASTLRNFCAQTEKSQRTVLCLEFDDKYFVDEFLNYIKSLVENLPNKLFVYVCVGANKSHSNTLKYKMEPNYYWDHPTDLGADLYFLLRNHPSSLIEHLTSNEISLLLRLWGLSDVAITIGENALQFIPEYSQQEIDVLRSNEEFRFIINNTDKYEAEYKMYRELAFHYAYTNNLERANYCKNKALSVIDKSSISDTTKRKLNLSDAIRALITQKSFYEVDESNFINELSVVAYNLGVCYRARGDYQKALIELNLSLELGRKTNKLYAEIEALLEIGRTYVDLEDYRTALIYFKQIDNSLSDRLDTRLLYIKGTVLAYTVYLNKELGSSENLLLLAEKAINIFSALGADEDIKKLREILWV